MKLFILIFVICMIALFVWLFKKEKIHKDFNPIQMIILIGSEMVLIFIGSIIISVFAYFAGGIIVQLGGHLISTSEKKEIVVETQQIYNLSDNESVSGSMHGNVFVFSGTVDEKYIYRFMVQTDNGLKLEELDAQEDEVYLNEGDYDPIIETCTIVRCVEGTSKIFEGWVNLQDPYEITLSTFYKIYVPEGTVTDEFNINMD